MNKEELLEHKNRKKQRIKNVLRVLISIIAFVCLIKFGKIDIHTALKYLLKVNPFYFALAFISYFIAICLAGFRFYLASHVLGFQKSYFQLLQLNFVGAFFNNFLPTTFGGDAMRGYYLKRGSHIPLSKAVACIIYERYTGVVVLFWASSAAFIFQELGFISKSVWEVPKQLAYVSHACSLVSIFLIPFLPQFSHMFLGKTNWLFKKIIEPVLVYWKNLKLMFKILVLSVFLQVFVILCHFFIAMSLNIKIPLSYYLIFYPLTTIAGFMIPSLNGLGVREGTYIYFLKKIQISTDQGLAFSIGWLIILMITSCIGGIVYLFGDFRKHKPLAAHPELD